jgi:aminoglycoside phosphotransferase (APT) family kinase protein
MQAGDVNFIPFLNAIKKELASRLHPDSDKAMARQIAMCTHRILARLVAMETTVPELRRLAVRQYRELQGEFATALAATDEGRRIAAQLCEQLEAASTYAVIEPVIQRAVRQLMQNPQAAALRLLRNIAEIESGISLKTQEAFARELVPQQQGEAPGDVLAGGKKEALERFLREKLGEDATVNIAGARAIPGGFSKQTLFVDLQNAAVLPSQLVIRLDQAASVVGTTVADEFHIIQTLFAAGVPVPQPFALEVDTSILGGAFLVVSRIEGEILGDPLDVAKPSREFALSLARTLAAMHRIAPETFDRRLSGATLSTRQRMLDDIESFQKRWDSSGISSIALQIGFSWLRANMHLADGARSLIHKDVGCHNVLVKDNQVAALLDWETAAIGNPAQDMGYLYHTITQMMDWHEFLGEYVAAGGRQLAADQIDFYSLWRTVWFLALLTEVRSGFLSGAAPDIQFAYAGEYLFQRVERQLHEALLRVAV